MLQTQREPLFHAGRAPTPAKSADAPIQQRADQIVRAVGLGILGASLITFVLWTVGRGVTHAFGPALAVLLVGSPLALAIVAPLAIRIARRTHRDVPWLPGVDTLFLDKGVLIDHRPELVDIVAPNPAELLRLAAAAEQDCEHPVARAIVSAAIQRELRIPTASEFVATSNHGVVARVEDHVVAIGNFPHMDALGIDVASLQGTADAMCSSGRTVLYVAVDRKLAGLLTTSNPIKATIPGVMRDLAKAGIRVVLITGDNRRTAQAIAEDLEIREVHSELTSDDKRAVIERVRDEGHRVIVADETTNMRALDRASQLVDKIVRNTHRGIAIGLGAIVIGSPLALLGAIGPVGAAIVSGASVVLVMANALRVGRVEV